MSWVHFDDTVPIGRAVAGLDDAAFRLYFEIVCWSARQATDGLVEADELRLVSKHRKPRHVLPLVRAGLLEVLPAGGWRVLGDWTVKPSGWRRPIPEQLREDVYRRDGYRCVECGATENLSLDHDYPWSKGGPDTYENLRTLCLPCNCKKGARI